jgi:hypothetical protein
MNMGTQDTWGSSLHQAKPPVCCVLRYKCGLWRTSFKENGFGFLRQFPLKKSNNTRPNRRPVLRIEQGYVIRPSSIWNSTKRVHAPPRVPGHLYQEGIMLASKVLRPMGLLLLCPTGILKSRYSLIAPQEEGRNGARSSGWKEKNSKDAKNHRIFAFIFSFFLCSARGSNPGASHMLLPLSYIPKV